MGSRAIMSPSELSRVPAFPSATNSFPMRLNWHIPSPIRNFARSPRRWSARPSCGWPNSSAFRERAVMGARGEAALAASPMRAVGVLGEALPRETTEAAAGSISPRTAAAGPARVAGTPWANRSRRAASAASGDPRMLPGLADLGDLPDPAATSTPPRKGGASPADRPRAHRRRALQCSGKATPRALRRFGGSSVSSSPVPPDELGRERSRPRGRNPARLAWPLVRPSGSPGRNRVRSAAKTLKGARRWGSKETMAVGKGASAHLDPPGRIARP